MAGESHIDPIFGERPSRFAERVGQVYADSSFHKDKKHKGQFFTPLAISEFMGGLATPSGKKALSVMDPGCGLAILSCALIEHLVEKSKPEHVSLTLFETDKKVIPLAECVLSYLKAWCEDRRVKLDYQLNDLRNVSVWMVQTPSLETCSGQRNMTILSQTRLISSWPRMMSILDPAQASLMARPTYMPYSWPFAPSSWQKTAR